jgi:hypothetical protein
VKAFTRALCLATVMMGMLGVIGCGPDNEAEGKKASAALGDPGPAKEGTGKTITVPKNNADRANMGPQGSITEQGKATPAPAKK